MADIGLDFASTPPGAAAVKAAGYTFVARYLSRYTAKTIKKPEYDDYVANDVGVVLVFEDYAAQALQGYAQGVSDAQVALAQANALGWPSDRPIHFAVDFDINDAQKPAAGEYMKGAASVLGANRVGAYGGFYWIRYCDENNLAASNARWQAVAWSGGQIHPTATLFQRLGGTNVNGTDCDINDALKPDYGQNNGGNMPTLIDEEGVRILAVGILNRPEPLTTTPDLQSHIGGDALAKIKEFWYSDEGVAANKWQQAAPGLIAELQKRPTQDELDAANAEIKKLQDQLAAVPAPTPTTTPDPSSSTVTVTGSTGFWDWLKSLFGKKS